MAATSTAAERPMPAAVGIGPLHHLDHVLRAGHGGWPSTATVTPLTWRLLAYPALGFAWRARSAPAVLRGALVAVLAGFAPAAPTLIEAPFDQCAVWAWNFGTGPRAAGVSNLPGVHSRFLGGIAVAVSPAPNAALVAAAALFLAAGLPRRGEA